MAFLRRFAVIGTSIHIYIFTVSLYIYLHVYKYIIQIHINKLFFKDTMKLRRYVDLLRHDLDIAGSRNSKWFRINYGLQVLCIRLSRWYSFRQRNCLSNPNSTLRCFPSYLLLTLLLYFLFICYLPWCSLLDFPSVSILASTVFLSCSYRAATTFYQQRTQSTIVSEGFKGGTRGSPIMPRDAVSRTANVGTVGKNGLIERKSL